MTQFAILEPEPDYQPPSISEPGRVLFEIYHIDCMTKRYDQRYLIEVHDWDADTSVFWLSEGVGIDYFVTDLACLELDECGFYVIEGISGHFIKGDGWVTDDDEDWYFANVRRADTMEIVTGALR